MAASAQVPATLQAQLPRCRYPDPARSVVVQDLHHRHHSPVSRPASDAASTPARRHPHTRSSETSPGTARTPACRPSTASSRPDTRRRSDRSASASLQQPDSRYPRHSQTWLRYPHRRPRQRTSNPAVRNSHIRLVARRSGLCARGRSCSRLWSGRFWAWSLWARRSFPSCAGCVACKGWARSRPTGRRNGVAARLAGNVGCGDEALARELPPLRGMIAGLGKYKRRACRSLPCRPTAGRVCRIVAVSTESQLYRRNHITNASTLPQPQWHQQQ